jgi:tetratricopeptide (TPR) repeat protein
VRRTILELAPWLLIGLPFILVTKAEMPDAIMPFHSPYWARPLVAMDALAFYLYKLVYPRWLGPDYGRTPDFVREQGYLWWTWILPVLTGWLAWFAGGKKIRGNGYFMGYGIFVLALLPTLGLITYDCQHLTTVADRYLYIPLVGVSFQASLFLLHRMENTTPLRLRSAQAASAALILVLGVATYFQSQIWKDTYALFERGAEVNPRSTVAHLNIGAFAVDHDDLPRALHETELALEIEPNSAQAYSNLGIIYEETGQPELSDAFFGTAMQLDPDFLSAYEYRGNARLKRHQFSGAVRDLHELVERDSSRSFDVHLTIADALAESGRYQKAIDHYQAALGFRPKDTRVRNNLGNAWAQMGRLDLALENFAEAVEIDPTLAESHYNLGNVYNLEGKPKLAAREYEKAILNKHDYKDAVASLQKTLHQLGDISLDQVNGDK